MRRRAIALSAVTSRIPREVAQSTAASTGTRTTSSSPTPASRQRSNARRACSNKNSIRAGGEGAFTTNGDGWFGLRNSSDDTPVHGWDGHSPLLTFGNSTDVAPVGPGNLLAAPYPNPFNPSTTLRFETTAEQSFLRLAIVDTAGRQLRVLAQGRFESGTHSVVWDGRDDAGSPLPSGVYLARLTSGNGLEGSRKLMLVK